MDLGAIAHRVPAFARIKQASQRRSAGGRIIGREQGASITIADQFAVPADA